MTDDDADDPSENSSLVVKSIAIIISTREGKNISTADNRVDSASLDTKGKKGRR